MNKLLLMLFVAGYSTCPAQTNCAPATAFVLPQIELRPFGSESQIASADPHHDRPTNSLWELTLARSETDSSLNGAQTNTLATTASFVLDSGMSDLELEVYRKLDQRGYLTRPESGSDIPAVRWLASTFEPSVFHIGKTSVSCSLVTAIKNRNPLCLLNPCVLSVSW